MIYLYNTIRSPVAKPVETELSDFEYLLNYEPDTLPESVHATTDGSKPVSDRMKQRLPYFYSGLTTDGKRTRDAIKNKGLVILDIERAKDDTKPLPFEEVKTEVAFVLKDYRYLLYPTVNNQPNYARYRLILEPERPMNEAESVALTTEIKTYLELRDLPVDSSCVDYARIHGLPVDNGLMPYEKVYHDGAKLPVKVIEDKEGNHVAKPPPVSEGEAYSLEQVNYIMNEYVALYGDQLGERNTYVAVKMQIIKSFQLGLIDDEAAHLAMSILAMGDVDWIEGNRREFELEKDRQNVRTKYDIRDIERLIKRNDPLDDFQTLEAEGDRPQTMQEQYQLIRDVGGAWRAANTITDDKGKVKIPRMPLDVASYLLTTYCQFLLIGSHPDTALIGFYNPDTGLYDTTSTGLNKLVKVLEDRFTPSQWRDLPTVIRTDAKLKPLTDEPNLIPVANGIYHTKDKALIPFDPKYVFLSKIKTSYDANAEKPIINGFDIDQWFNSIACGDEEVVTLLWQVINEAINPNQTRNKMGFLVGDGNSGKGTYQRLLQNLIGLENIATLKPPHFAERFSKAQLIGAVCNIGDDISNAYLDDVSDLMSIVTGDTIMIEEKHKSVFSINLKLFCLFSGNDMPNVRNKSHGWYRRLLLIPFNANFNGQKNDPRIKEEYLADEKLLQYVLKQALELDFTHFIEPEAVKEMIDDYKVENDYYRAFVRDVFVEENLIYFEKLPNTYVKQRLLEYMRDSGIGHSISHHFINPLVQALEEETGEKYGAQKAYYSRDYISTLPLDVDVKAGQQTQSIVKS